MNEQDLWLFFKILFWLLLAGLLAWLLARWWYRGKDGTSRRLQEEELSSTRLQLNQLQSSSATSQQKLAAAESELSALRSSTVAASELEKVQQLLQNNQRELSEAQNLQQNLQQQLEEAQKKHSAEVSSLKEASSQLIPKTALSDLQNQLNAAKEDLVTVRKIRDQLQQESKQLQDTDAATQRKYQDTLAQLEQLKKESAPQTELEQLRQSLSSKDSELANLHSKNQTLETQLLELRKTTIAQSEFDQIKHSLSAKEQELSTTSQLQADLQAELQSLRNNNEQLHLHFNSLQKVSDETESLRINLAKHETTLTEKQARLQQLEEDLNQAHTRENDLRTEIQTQAQELQTLRNSAVDQSELEQLQQRVREQEEAAKQLSQEKATLQNRSTELDHQLKTALEGKELLQRKLEEKQKEFQQTQGGHQELQIKFNQLQEDRQILAQSLNLKEQSIEADKITRQQLQSELASAATARSELEQKLQALQQENTKLLADLQSAEETQQLLQDDLSTQRQVYQRLQGEHEHLREDLSQAHNKMGELDQIKLSFAAQQESQQKLNTDLETERKEHHQSKQALTSQEREYKALQSQLKQAQEESQQLQLTLTQKEQAHAQLEAEQQTLHATLQESQATLQALNERLPVLQEAETAREQLTQELKTAVTERDKLLKQFETASADLERYKQELSLKKKTNSEAESLATKSANELKNYKIKASAVEEQLRISIASKNQANELLNTEIKNLRAAIENLNKQMVAKDNSIASITQKLQKQATPSIKVAKGLTESTELPLQPPTQLAAIPQETQPDERYGLIYLQRPQTEVDDLELINGVGPKLHQDLNEYGIYYFQQIASWTDANIAAFQERIGFPDRINREQWVQQAQRLWNLKTSGKPLTELHYTRDRKIVDDKPCEATGSEIQQKAYAAALEAGDAYVDPEVGVLFKQKPANADDLTLIKGVAETLNKKLHKFGIYYFKQIALWSQSSIEAFQKRIGFKDRIMREKWIQQCRQLHQDKYQEPL